MSYYEALEDHVRIGRRGKESLYYPLCQFCGAEVRSWHYLRGKRYTCERCRPFKKALLETGIFTQGTKDESKCD